MGGRATALAAGFLALALWPAVAHAASDEASLRQQLAAERRAADARFEQAQADCRQRFALNACLDEARAAHRQVVSRVQQRERELDAEQRRQRALDRQSTIDRRQRATEARPADPEARQTLGAAASAASAATRREGEARRARDVAAAQAKAAERAAAARRLQAAIEADQTRIRDRLAKRETQGRKAQPLPSPASAPSGGER